MARKGNDRFNALPSDGSENERDNSGEDDDARPSRPARGGNMKGTAQRTQLYCFCKRPYSDTEFMICCDGCENWFHGRCVGVTESMAQAIDTYYCPECQQSRDGEEEEAEAAVAAPKEKEKPIVETKPTLRSPASAPATPLEHKSNLPAPPPPPQPHSVTPPAASSRHKRKGLAMRAISKLTTILPPAALPAPEILAREAAKFKTEAPSPSSSTISHSLLDFAKTLQNPPIEKKGPSAAAAQLEASKRDPLSDLRARAAAAAADANSSDSPSSSANPEVGNVVTAERPSPDVSEDVQSKRRAVEAPTAEPPEENKVEMAVETANTREEPGRGRPKKGGRPSPKNPRRQTEEEPPAADAKPKIAAPSSNGSSLPPPPAAATPAAVPPSAAAAPSPAPAPSGVSFPPPSIPAPSSSSSQLQAPSPSPSPEPKGNSRYSKRKNPKKGEDEGKPAAPEVKGEPESQSEASQSQPAEVEPKRAKPRAKNAAANKEPPPPLDQPPLADDIIAPRRAKLAVYFPQDYNQRTGKPSPQPSAATEGKDDKSSEEESKEKTSPKKKPGKRKGQPTAQETPAEGEHLAPRRAKLAAYFPEDYKGNEKGEEGAEGEHKNDDPRSGQEERPVYCICKRSYDNRSFMIQCKSCNDWFHGTCVGIAWQEAKRIKNFVCPRCSGSEKRVSDR